MAKGREDLAREIQNKKEDLIRLLSELVRQKTVNPPGNEHLVAKIVEKRFKKLGIKHKIFEKKKGRTNILGYVGKGKPELLIACHSDVVPAGKGWKTSPFTPTLKGDKLYGRGASDNKGPLAAMLILGELLKKIETKLKGTITLAVVADEEAGSQYGMKYLINNKLIKPTWAIIPDVGGHMKKIIIAEKGVLELKVIVEGKQAHASTPQLGINAIELMSNFIQKLKRHKPKYKPHPLLKKPTINVGMIKGGTAPNIVAGSCEARIDIRYVPSQTPQGIIKELRKLAGKNFKFKTTLHMRPSQLQKNHILVKTLMKNLEKVEKKAKCQGMGGVTVAKNLIHNGIPALVYGPGGDDIAHMSNEWVSIKELQKFIQVTYLTTLDLLKT